MQRLAALVPRPRLHLIRFGVRITSLREVSGPPLREHGVLASNAKLRALVVSQGVPQEPEAPEQEAKPADCEANCAHHRPVRLSWTKLLKRVFDLDLEHCPEPRWRAEDHRSDPGYAGDREDPHALGSAGVCTASGAGSRPSAASGLKIPIHHRSGGPQCRATGIGCARGLSGPMDVARRQGLTRR